ncbi:sensor histidine kinase [Paraburkholderia rhynchosiae]|uniref:histidine kinase n=1 Tax=Paraburkholderia rhynchosiae TaxID=487049 RepID=A0A2N7WA70_9BURK|nr:sensor histidine kinase [Paraburkholderia rhynchosiae]PMS26298.1 two-component sensor histidine kinase [Paraburkholderia rhynchosiae]CAB3729880.1 Adaptive-response sensory-kinase SasA [Paraburkholderia rhynchosiae]
MNLADFIEANLEVLVEDWTEYATRVSAKNSELTVAELRNWASELLTRIAADMKAAQSAVQQKAKSRGESGAQSSVSTAASRHADDRLAQGFRLNDVIAEFRALRASVLRRWEQTAPAGADAFQEMIRFNEAVDQALTESVRQYTQRTDRIRDLFAGVLAHDLRSPLGAIANSAEVLLHDDSLSALSVRAAANVQRGAGRMKRLIDDLLDFTRTRLGDTLPIQVVSLDIGRLCSNTADEVRASYPQAQIELRLEGDLGGWWDGDRIGQLIANLLVNAVQHGSGAIELHASGSGDAVSVAVSNDGNPIPHEALPTLFDPLTRTYSPPERRGAAAGIGLGLYICKRIVEAHHGEIRADSTARGTTFSVTLPRSNRATANART